MGRAVLVCALMACLAPRALGEPSDPNNVIWQHNPQLTEGTHYTINQSQRRVTIIQGVIDQTFEFEAGLYGGDPSDPDEYVGPGNIDYILAAENAGPVNITVVGHNGHQFGALNVGQVDLDAAGVTGTIVDLLIDGDLAEFGPVRAAVVDYISLNGNILDDVELGLLTGWVWCIRMRGLTATTSPAGTAGIYVESSWGEEGDSISIQGPLNEFWIFGDVLSYVDLQGPVGYLWITGDVLAGVKFRGPVENLRVVGDVAPPPNYTLAIEEELVGGVIEGSLSGTMKVPVISGGLDIWNDLSGELRVEHQMTQCRITGALSGHLRVDDVFYGILGVNHGDLSGEVVLGGF